MAYDPFQRRQGSNGGDQAGANPSGLGKQIVLSKQQGKQVITPTPEVANTVLSKQQGKLNVDPPTVLSKMEGKTLVPRLANPPTQSDLGVSPVSATTSQVIGYQDPPKVADYQARKAEFNKPAQVDQPFKLGSGRGLGYDINQALSPDNLRKPLPASGGEAIASGLESAGRALGSFVADSMNPEVLRTPLPARGQGLADRAGNAIKSGYDYLTSSKPSNEAPPLLAARGVQKSGNTYSDNRSLQQELGKFNDSFNKSFEGTQAPQSTAPETPKDVFGKSGVSSYPTGNTVIMANGNQSNEDILNKGYQQPVIVSPNQTTQGVQASQTKAQPSLGNFQQAPSFETTNYSTDAQPADIAAAQNMFERAVAKGQPKLAAVLGERLNQLSTQGNIGDSLSSKAQQSTNENTLGYAKSLNDLKAKQAETQSDLATRLQIADLSNSTRQETNDIAKARLGFDATKAEQESARAEDTQYQGMVKDLINPSRLMDLPPEKSLAAIAASKKGPLTRKDLSLAFPQGASEDDMMASLRSSLNLPAEEAYKLLRQ